MFLWATSSDAAGVYITIYDPNSREAIDINCTAKFPDIEVSSHIYELRGDLKIRSSAYQRLPSDFEKIVKRSFETGKAGPLSSVIFDRLLHPALLENYNVPKTMGNLQDMGYTFH